MQEIMELRAELVEPEKGIQSNVAALQKQCLDLAEEMRGARKIHDPEGYREAKAARAAVRRAIKQVEDERKRVKVAWTAPLTTFETSVKGALQPLSEVEGEWAGEIRDYEARAREAKRARLEAYWEGTYPALALCTGEDEEPLVPFQRVLETIGPSWLRKMSEVGEGHDGIAKARMDELADNLAHGAEVIAGLEEPQEVRTAALSELYRSFNVAQAIGRAKQEHRRQSDIARLGEAQAATGVPAVEPRVTPVGDSSRRAFEMPGRGSFEPVGYVVIPIRDREHKDAVVAVMREAGIHGAFRRSIEIEGSKDDE